MKPIKKGTIKKDCTGQKVEVIDNFIVNGIQIGYILKRVNHWATNHYTYTGCLY